MNQQNGGATRLTPFCPEMMEDKDAAPPKHVPITIATYNICSGHAGCLELALQAADQMKVAAMFYKAVVQAVLLYGAEMWSVTPQILQAL